MYKIIENQLIGLPQNPLDATITFLKFNKSDLQKELNH